MSIKPIVRFHHSLAAIVLAAGMLFTATEVSAARAAGRETMEQPVAAPVTPIVTATGNATVSLAPDQAVVTLGAATVAATSTEAQDKLNVAVDRIVKAVKGLSLPDLKVQTQWLSLQPVYEQVDYREGQRQPREPKIIGYNASNTVRVTIGDVGKAGAIIDAAIAAGANQVQGLSFELKDDREAKAQALKAAAVDARSKAQAMAEALGLRVVRIIEVQSGTISPPRPMYRGRGMQMDAAAFAAAPTVVEPGEVSVSEQVTVAVEVAPQ